MKIIVEEKVETVSVTYPVLRKDSNSPCVLLMISRTQGIGLVERNVRMSSLTPVKVGQIVNVQTQSDERNNTVGFGYGDVAEFERNWPVIHGKVTIEL